MCGITRGEGKGRCTLGNEEKYEMHTFLKYRDTETEGTVFE